MMGDRKSTFILLLVICLLLVSLLVSTSSASESYLPKSLQPTGQELMWRDRALDFLRSVFMIDTSKYTVPRVITSESPLGTFVTLQLRSDDSKFDMGSNFRHTKIIWCKLYTVEGSPVYLNTASSDVLNTAKDTMNRIQAYSPKDYLQDMQSMLDTITELNNSKITTGNITQKITIDENVVSIK